MFGAKERGNPFDACQAGDTDRTERKGGYFPSAIFHFCGLNQAAWAAIRKIAVFPSLNPPDEPFLFVASACTVDLEMPNCVAAERTVARFSMMYTARSQARSSIFVYKYTTPHSLVVNVYERGARYMFGSRSPR